MEIVFGYVDPASGSLIIQAIIGGLIAAPILLRNKIAQGVRVVRRGLTRGTEPRPGDSTPPR